MINKRHGQEKGEKILGDAEKLLKFAQDKAMTRMVTRDPAFCSSEMRRLAKNDPNSKFVEQQPKELLSKPIRKTNYEELQKLYIKYVRRPCRDYVMKLETIFMPADFDSHYLLTLPKQDELVFYLNWVAFSHCDLMVLYTYILYPIT